ncbi:hypothetical protein [Permianibacter aggregans]|uniref:Uncharacterized protein n=1 Tax=Permianibacter aggregans TaxID=1510150 RepID=A0A4R6UWF6_9GAMM|nr:hypothetical protein [Permianibacter aggregans]QGX38801.1 hypothetical protein E2H98_03645 [Permianibacter aggregans]TDQ50606.1 hypothetical protein EV696_102289 [Permianibacter aggregans]
MTATPCPICGTPYQDHCPFDVPRAQAPWLADYDKLPSGEMSRQRHQLQLARWSLHHPQEISTNAERQYRKLVRDAWGEP